MHTLESTVHRLLGVLCTHGAATRTCNVYFSRNSRPWKGSGLEGVHRFTSLVRHYGHGGFKVTMCSSHHSTVERALRAYSTPWDSGDQFERDLLEVREHGTAHCIDTERGVTSAAVPGGDHPVVLRRAR